MKTPFLLALLPLALAACSGGGGGGTPPRQTEGLGGLLDPGPVVDLGVSDEPVALEEPEEPSGLGDLAEPGEPVGVDELDDLGEPFDPDEPAVVDPVPDAPNFTVRRENPLPDTDPDQERVETENAFIIQTVYEPFLAPFNAIEVPGYDRTIEIFVESECDPEAPAFSYDRTAGVLTACDDVRLDAFYNPITEDRGLDANRESVARATSHVLFVTNVLYPGIIEAVRTELEAPVNWIVPMAYISYVLTESGAPEAAYLSAIVDAADHPSAPRLYDPQQENLNADYWICNSINRNGPEFAESEEIFETFYERTPTMDLSRLVENGEDCVTTYTLTQNYVRNTVPALANIGATSISFPLALVQFVIADTAQPSN